MQHKDIQNLLEAYAVDALDKEDLTTVQSHIQSGCIECESKVKELKEATSKLALTLPLAPPPERIKERIMPGVRKSKNARSTNSDSKVNSLNGVGPSQPLRP